MTNASFFFVAVGTLLLGGCSSHREEVSASALDLTAGDPLPSFASFEPVHLFDSAEDCVRDEGAEAQFKTSTCSLKPENGFYVRRLANGHYVFENVATGRCLDVRNDNVVVSSNCNDGTSQQWRPIELRIGVYRLQAEQTGLCLQSDGSLATVPCRDLVRAQRFEFYRAETTSLRVNGRCVGVLDASIEEDVAVGHWRCAEPKSAHQSFFRSTLVRGASSSESLTAASASP